MNNEKTIRPNINAIEGIDFNKLKIVIVNNWFWLALIFIAINAVALLYIRYTKNIYESQSDLKLEVKDDASDLGIKTVVEDQNLNLISGEIEIIQSKLFLARVLDSAGLDISYHSLGRVLNEELFFNSPFYIKYKINNNSFYNTPIYFEEEDEHSYNLRVDKDGPKVTGTYDKPLPLGGSVFTVTRNANFKKGDEVGYFFIIKSRDVLLDYLLDNLTAEPLNFNANTIRVSFRDFNAFKAQYILNRIDSMYLHFSNEQKNLANRQKIEWLTNELRQIERNMEGYEDYFEKFTLENKTNDLDADLSATIQVINRIDSQRYDMTQRISGLTQLIETLEKGEYVLSLVQRQALPQSLNKNLDDLQQLILQQEKLKMSYSDMTFAYRSNQSGIEILKKKSLTQLREIQTEWHKRLQDLNVRKQSLENEFAHLPDKNTQFSKNLRFYKLNEQLYLTLMQSKSEFEIAQAGSTPDFRILSPAFLPHAPLSPKKSMIAAAGFVASFTFIILFIGISYLANNKITGLYDIENSMDIPVLGIVPSSRNSKNNGLHVSAHPKSMVSEAIRTLRTNLDFFNAHAPKKVMAVSSTVSGEGKSFIAMNLGAMMALSNKKAVLLDLDMRKPKAGLPFEMNDKSKGMSTILIGKHNWEDCVVKTTINTFDYIPSGPHPPNPSELLLNEAFDNLLISLKKTYDYIILDTPPVGLVTDGIMAMKRADLSIYIFRANYSKKDFLSNLQRIISINKFSNLTVVLNALPSTGEQHYGYGYYEDPRPIARWKKIFST